MLGQDERGIPALLGLQHMGSCAGSDGSEGDNPIQSCPRDGVFLREEQGKALAGRVPSSRRGAA